MKFHVNANLFGIESETHDERYNVSFNTATLNFLNEGFFCGSLSSNWRVPLEDSRNHFEIKFFFA